MVRVGHVSWLEADDPPSRVSPVASWTDVPLESGPLTVAGPRRIFTGFRNDPPYDLVSLGS